VHERDPQLILAFVGEFEENIALLSRHFQIISQPKGRNNHELLGAFGLALRRRIGDPARHIYFQ
jgi:hypothetical protein